MNPVAAALHQICYVKSERTRLVPGSFLTAVVDLPWRALIKLQDGQDIVN